MDRLKPNALDGIPAELMARARIAGAFSDWPETVPLISTYPSSAAALEALHIKGNSQHLAGNYAQAIETFEQVQEFITGAIELLGGDFMDFEWDWRPPDRLVVRVNACFAHKGMMRLGVADRYECGLFDRIYGWLDVLGVEHQRSPTVKHCTLFHAGTCVREIRFSFSG